MNVLVEIELETSLKENDVEQMYSAAKLLTDDLHGIEIEKSDRGDKFAKVRFTIVTARQMDVVDSIGKVFRRNVENNLGASIYFPKTERASKKKKQKITQKQGQYLSFIYYYKKVNGTSPAESDIQRYFEVSPPSVHSMIVKLEANGYIKRKPKVSRSIEILVQNSEIPELL